MQHPPERFDRVTVFGAGWSVASRRVKRLLQATPIEWDFIDVEHTRGAGARVEAVTGERTIPVVVFPDGTYLVEPSDKALHERLETLHVFDDDLVAAAWRTAEAR